jgi:hypothetical protein
MLWHESVGFLNHIPAVRASGDCAMALIPVFAVGGWRNDQRIPACVFPHDRSSMFVFFFVKLTARMLPSFSQLQTNFADSRISPEPVGGKVSLSSRDF